MPTRKAVTIRIPEARLRRLMRMRKARSQSDLINGLLAEEEERLLSHRALRDAHGTAKRKELDDRLL